MLQVYGPYKYFDSYRVGIDFGSESDVFRRLVRTSKTAPIGLFVWTRCIVLGNRELPPYEKYNIQYCILYWAEQQHIRNKNSFPTSSATGASGMYCR